MFMLILKHLEDKVYPIFNRCVIFTTSENSHHGHPDQLTCPENITRKSLAWYYYTVENGENIANEPHSTLYKHRPGEFKLFTVRNIKNAIRYCLPPIALDFSRKIRGIKN